jgi:hypothetical protein
MSTFRRPWSREDDMLLCGIYSDTPTADVARRLKRTVAAIYGRADKLGLEKSPAYLASPAACRLRRGDQVGARFRFQKGHVPANKGLRRPGFGPGRMKETQFRNGQLNGVAARRFKPIGSTRTIDGYLYRKLTAIPGPWTRNWKLVHVLLWESLHGPVPAGHAVAFKNGDRTDIRPENLELIHRRVLMARNTVHNLPKPLAQTVQLLGALRRQINRRARK